MMAGREEAPRIELKGAVSDGYNRQTKKNAFDHGCYKHRSVYSKGRECPGSEKTALNKQREELVSQNKTVI